MRFEFATANKIIFGLGTMTEAGVLAAQYGKRALVVSGITRKRVQGLLNLLNDGGIEFEIIYVYEEPTIGTIQEGVERARNSKCNLVIGYGGGSAIDSGKAIAALMTNEGEILDYLEVIGAGKPIKNPPLPYIAIPTTAGTGAEVTRNAVIGSPDHHVKVSLRSPLMLPTIAIIDPELTYSLPPKITASTGMDALTQVIEPFVSKLSNPLTDAICVNGMRLASESLENAYLNGYDQTARLGMSLVSLFGGLALANAKLGAVHGFAGPLGGMYNAPHGVICARLLPPVMAINVKALRSRGTDMVFLTRFDEVGVYLTGDSDATAEDGVNWIQTLSERLEIPSLSDFGVKQEDFPNIVEKAARASSMKGNPIELTQDEMLDILEQAL